MKKNNLFILILIALLFVSIKASFFKSSYELLTLSYDERLNNSYGFCEREGIGYANFIKKEFNIKSKIELINSLKKNNNNSGKWFMYNSNFKESEIAKYLIIINNDKLNPKINLNEYKIIHNFKDCYFLKKND